MITRRVKSFDEAIAFAEQVVSDQTRKLKTDLLAAGVDVDEIDALVDMGLKASAESIERMRAEIVRFANEES